MARAIALCVAMALGVLVTLRAPSAFADEVALPPAKQAELLAKVVDYDRNFLARAGARARIVILVKPGDGDSVRTATQMQVALAHIEAVAGRPHDDSVEPYAGAAALAEECRSQHVAIVIVGPGFRDEIEPIRTALDGVDVLTVTAVADFVPKGIVLGFDLMGGRPRILLQLAQARRQHVAFMAEALRLMQVYE